MSFENPLSFENLTLAEATQKIFVLQCLTVFVVWSIFGMSYTPPLVLSSDNLPFLAKIAATITNWILGLIDPKLVVRAP
ncbi:MAG: hypothetical protein Q7R94_02170, partial [bacterium]|nr:hypothetical protein [bacterium]